MGQSDSERRLRTVLCGILWFFFSRTTTAVGTKRVDKRTTKITGENIFFSFSLFHRRISPVTCDRSVFASKFVSLASNETDRSCLVIRFGFLLFGFSSEFVEKKKSVQRLGSRRLRDTLFSLSALFFFFLRKNIHCRIFCLSYVFAHRRSSSVEEHARGIYICRDRSHPVQQ